MYEDLRFEIDGHVGVLTIDRPDVRNALRRQTYEELEDVVRSLDDDGVRCLVDHGRRPGLLLRRRRAADHGGAASAPTAPLASAPRLTPAADALLHTDVPVIAAVNGAAVGWGMELALMADIRVASERAKFGELFVLRGLVTDVAGHRPPGLAGRPRAGGRAAVHRRGDRRRRRPRDIGLVGRVVAHDDLLPTAPELARRIAANPPLAVQVQAGLRQALDPDWPDARSVGVDETHPAVPDRGPQGGRRRLPREAAADYTGR